MSEGNVQLPPNSTGQQIRIETGDASNQIPASVGEEVVIVSDAQGLLPGDARQRAIPVEVITDTLHAVVAELRQIKFLLADGFDSKLRPETLASLGEDT